MPHGEASASTSDMPWAPTACPRPYSPSQTYGDQLNWHPHLHSLLADGAWGKRDDAFQPIAWLDADILSSAFRQQVLAMMVEKRRLSAEFAQNISNWRHSGFYVHYRTAKGVARSMDALDWIAQVFSHIPDPVEQMVRYYGWYSNVSRGKRRKPGVSVPVEAEVQDAPQPESDGEHFARQRRRSWARLLKKIYEVDPLRCPHCGSEMQIIAWIEQSEVIRKILRHLDLWPLPQVQMPDRSLSGSLTYNWGDFLDGSKRTLARIMHKLL